MGQSVGQNYTFYFLHERAGSVRFGSVYISAGSGSTVRFSIKIAFLDAFGSIGWGIEAKIAARAPARAAIFAIHPLGPLGPPHGAPWGHWWGIGYWLLVIAGSNGSV